MGFMDIRVRDLSSKSGKNWDYKEEGEPLGCRRKVRVWANVEDVTGIGEKEGVCGLGKGSRPVEREGSVGHTGLLVYFPSYRQLLRNMLIGLRSLQIRAFARH